MSQSVNVVIGGGTGLIGKALSAKLTSMNINIRIISRCPRGKGDLSWKTIETCGLPEDTHVLVNLAGRTIGEINPMLLFPKNNRQFLEELRSSRIETTKMLVNNLPTSAKKMINSSAVGFYKPDMDRCYTEDDPYVDYDFITRLVHEWESSCAGPKLSGVQCVLLRTGVVLSKNGGALSSMYWPHRLGLGGPVGNGRQWFSWIHIDDLVNLVCFLITDPSSESLTGPINATSPNPVRQYAFSRALSESVGAPPLGGRLPTPPFVIRAMMGRERAPLLLEGQRVLPVKAQAAGFKFAFPTLEAALENIYGKRPGPVPID
uniref:DUF1731 domain-containing protein n=1 Tax=Mesocestoides corti TaxID=53468 RepID=A0A5K3F7R9_MESCO